MKINKHYKPEKVVSADEMRPILQKIFIDNDCAVSTNGRTIAILPIEVAEQDVVKQMIDPQVLTIARGLVPAENTDIEMELNDCKAILSQGISIPLQLELLKPDDRYVDYKSVIPKGDPKLSISLDVKELNKLTAAFGCSKVIIGFYGENKILRIIPLSETSKEVGYMMPITDKELINKEE
jgi:hypothetical protein